MSRVLALAAFLLLVPFHAGAQTINLTTDPPGAKLYRVDRSGIRTLIGTGMARFKVEKDDPNQLVVESDGFEPLNQVFRKGDKYPKDLRITLLNRLVKVSALPYDAQILVNGRTAGMQSVDVVILAGTLATSAAPPMSSCPTTSASTCRSRCSASSPRRNGSATRSRRISRSGPLPPSSSRTG